MRNITLTIGMLLASYSWMNAQNLYPYSIPNVSLNPNNTANYNGVIEGYSIGDDGNSNVEIEIDGNQNLELKASDNIYLDGEWNVHPNSNGNFYAHIEPSNFDLVWFEPHSPGSVPIYEKLELGVQFDQTVNTAIANYIQNTNPTDAKLNPFNPEDIEVSAYFQYLNPATGQPVGVTGEANVYGFYYKDFERNLSDVNAENWWWTPLSMVDNVNSAYNFRIRFAPFRQGNWKCTVTTKINNTVIHTAKPFTFLCTASNTHGYMKVGGNSRYFTIDGETYVPAGKNFPAPEQDYHYDPTWTNYDGPTSMPRNDRRHTPAFYMSYQKSLEQYGETGGQYFRMMLFGSNYEVEFENLNNYYDRMQNAWEMDRLMETLKDNDLLMELNLKYHTALIALESNDKNYNWVGGSETPVHPSNPQFSWQHPTCVACQSIADTSYCYREELNLTQPYEYLVDPESKKMQKWRLRYIASRWGYSTNIAMIQMFNEVNNINHEGYVEYIGPPDGSGGCTDILLNEPYNTSIVDNVALTTSLPEIISNWHSEMGNFLKSDQHFSQLTSVSYLVNGPHISSNDLSYIKSSIDVPTHNTYYAPIDDWKSEAQAMKFYVDSVYLPHMNGYNVTKPIYYSETGSPSDHDKCDNGILFVKNLWKPFFTGAAGAGNSWFYRYETDKNEMIETFQDFVGGVNFADANTYWESQTDNWSANEVEMFCLKSDEQRNRAIGVVDNKTVNHYTMADPNSHCNNTASKDEIEDEFEMALSLSPKVLDKIQLEGMGFKNRYVTEWYSLPSGTHLSNEDDLIRSTAGGKLKLDFPVLAAQIEGSMLAFKIRRINEPSFYQLNNDLTFSEEELAKDQIEIDSIVVLTNWEIEKSQNDLIKISPNPAKSFCNVSFSGELSSAVILSVVSSSGKVLLKKEMTKPNIKLNTSNYPDGNYIIIITSNNTTYVKQLVIQ